MRHLLNKHNVQISRLSEITGLSRQTIHNQLETENPKIKNAELLINALNFETGEHYTLYDFVEDVKTPEKLSQIEEENAELKKHVKDLEGTIDHLIATLRRVMK